MYPATARTSLSLRSLVALGESSGYRNYFTTAYHLQVVGQAERSARTIVERLLK